MADQEPTNPDPSPSEDVQPQAESAPAEPGTDPEKLATEALAAAEAAVEQLSKDAGADGAQPFNLQKLQADVAAGMSNPEGLALISDVNLNVKIELGRTRMLVDDVLKLSEGAVVELDKLAGDPVDVFVNERHVARGEVLVLNDNFCVRINEILSPGRSELGQLRKR